MGEIPRRQRRVDRRVILAALLAMQLHHVIHLAKEICALRHLSLSTEKTYLHWIGRYASFLKQHRDPSLGPEQKMAAFLMLYLHAEAERVISPLRDFVSAPCPPAPIPQASIRR